jgi:hypothetical protein
LRCPGLAPSQNDLLGALRLVRFSKDGRRVLAEKPPGPQAPETSLEVCVWEAATGQPLTLPLPSIVPGLLSTEHLFDPEGRSFARLRPDGILELTELTAEDRPLDEERALAQALSGRRINVNSGLLPLEEAQFRKAWGAVRERAWPGPRALLAARAWHRREAEAASSVVQITRDKRAQRKNARAAEWHLSRLLETAPRDLEALKLRAALRGEAGHWEEALRDWNAVRGAGGVCWYERGNAQAQLGRWKAAEADFTQAAKETAGAGQALSALALVRLQQKNDAGYRDACMRLLAAGPLDVDALCYKGGFKPLIAAPDALKDWAFLDKLPNLQGGPYTNALAALQYRRGGRDAEALGNLKMEGPNQAVLEVNTAARWFLRAMLQHRLKQPSKESLVKGRQALAQPVFLRDTPWLAHQPESWQERVYAEALEREATKMIEGK